MQLSDTRLDGTDIFAYMTDVLERLSILPYSRIDELLRIASTKLDKLMHIPRHS